MPGGGACAPARLAYAGPDPPAASRRRVDLTAAVWAPYHEELPWELSLAISRKELKSDEFVSGVDAAYEFFLQHRDRIIVAAVAVVIVVGAAWGVFAWRSSRNHAASALLAQAINTLHAPVGQNNVPAGIENYPTDAARATAAAKQFEAVVHRYGSTQSGQLAEFYLGLAQMVTDRSQGQATLERVSKSSDAIASTAAKHALANVYVSENNPQQAHQLLLELSQQDSATFPRPAALMELADLDRTYNPQEAVKYYKQLQAEFPNTTTADQAAQMLATLPGQPPASQADVPVASAPSL